MDVNGVFLKVRCLPTDVNGVFLKVRCFFNYELATQSVSIIILHADLFYQTRLRSSLNS
jgi:hypothetical protein